MSFRESSPPSMTYALVDERSVIVLDRDQTWVGGGPGLDVDLEGAEGCLVCFRLVDQGKIVVEPGGGSSEAVQIESESVAHPKELQLGQTISIGRRTFKLVMLASDDPQLDGKPSRIRTKEPGVKSQPPAQDLQDRFALDSARLRLEEQVSRGEKPRSSEWRPIAAASLELALRDKDLRWFTSALWMHLVGRSVGQNETVLAMSSAAHAIGGPAWSALTTFIEAFPADAIDPFELDALEQLCKIVASATGVEPRVGLGAILARDDES